MNSNFHAILLPNFQSTQVLRELLQQVCEYIILYYVILIWFTLV